jgi:hypothetical protein
VTHAGCQRAEQASAPVSTGDGGAASCEDRAKWRDVRSYRSLGVIDRTGASRFPGARALGCISPCLCNERSRPTVASRRDRPYKAPQYYTRIEDRFLCAFLRKKHELEDEMRFGGHPPTRKRVPARQGDPCTPFFGGYERVREHPQAPGRESPAPPSLMGWERVLGGHPQTPGRGDPLHPMCYFLTPEVSSNRKGLRPLLGRSLPLS